MMDKLISYFGFSRMPFGRDLAPGMLHRHTAHDEAVARIGWCVAERRIGVITGEVGAGKTVAVRAARAAGRPTTLDYLSQAFDGFTELHGDRLGADCPAVVAGLARLGDRQVAVVGHQKGHDTKELLARNFGMPTPAGYRKALRVMRLIEAASPTPRARDGRIRCSIQPETLSSGET